MNPVIANGFFEGKVDQELYALSEMIQWIWRSAKHFIPLKVYLKGKNER